MQDARRVLTEAGVQVVTAWTESDGIEKLTDSATPIDGVITDLFMPHAPMSPWNESDQPCGLAVALCAERAGIPFVICTAGYHHGAKYDWICQLGRARGWPAMVDVEPTNSANRYHAEGPVKDWARAWESLEQQIAKT
ncbi:MAG: hypothetical protein WBK28_02545 [Minisyncoccia bacterium]